MPREKKKLGAWFPKASVIKGASYDPEVVKSISLLLFYQYAEPMWSDARKVAAMAREQADAEREQLRCDVEAQRQKLEELQARRTAEEAKAAQEALERSRELELLRQQQADVPTVACVLLSQQQAADAAARGVPVAMADVLAAVARPAV